MRAYILITAKPGTSEELLSSLKEARTLKGVVSADSVFGRFDAIVVIDVETLEEIGNIVYQVIEKNPNIIHTETATAIFRE